MGSDVEERMLYRKRLPCGCRCLFVHPNERLMSTVRVSPFRLQRCLRHMNPTGQIDARAEFLAVLDGS